jgi:3-deoxy-7-phosphoheptulonate synthase
VDGVKIGGGNFVLMAGPCSVESEEQILASARAVSAGGATALRGGAFKPRSSPYAFQGLGKKGLDSETSPPVGEVIAKSDVGYHNRAGGHSVEMFDWLRFLQFAEFHLKPKKP